MLDVRVCEAPEPGAVWPMLAPSGSAPSRHLQGAAQGRARCSWGSSSAHRTPLMVQPPRQDPLSPKP